MVRDKVKWFKAHRDILQSDIVHVREVTGQSLDAFLHVNPRLPRRVAPREEASRGGGEHG